MAFLLEAQDTEEVALVDEAGEESDEDIFFEEAVSSTIQPSRMWRKMPI